MKLLKMNKMIRFTTLLVFVFLSTNLFAQNNKMKERANVLVEEMNSQIISEDKGLSLSENQKINIREIITQRIQAVKDLKKSESSKEKGKEVQKSLVKEYNQKIYSKILSNEQRLALREARKKIKDKKNKP